MTGNPMIDKVLLGLNGLVAIGAAAMVFYAHNNLKPPPTDQAAEEKSLESGVVAEAQVTPHTFKKMVVNIQSPGTRLRYLEVEMGVLPFAEGDKETIKSLEYKFQNALIDIAGSMSPDELSSVTGKILLEGRLKKRLNEEFGSALIKQIYFSRFIVQ